MKRSTLRLILHPTLRHPLALLALVVGLAACTQVTEPTFYLLETAGPKPTTAPTTSAGDVIGLREIDLPLYARRPQIPVLAPDGSVSVSDAHRWAEEPARATTRLIARRISASLGRPLVVEPWPPEIVPRARVDVEIDYVIGSLGGVFRLEGQYRSFATGSPSSAVTTPFALEEPVTGPSHADLVAAQSRALTALADAIAAVLRR